MRAGSRCDLAGGQVEDEEPEEEAEEDSLHAAAGELGRKKLLLLLDLGELLLLLGLGELLLVYREAVL